MKIIIFSVLGLIIFSSCSLTDNCENQLNFISTDEPIPIYELDYSDAPEKRLEKMNALYGIDLCEKCSLVNFKSPFTNEWGNGYFKLIVDFDYPRCSEKCPIKMRVRNYFSIVINSRNELLVEERPISNDSLKKEIISYLYKVGSEIEYPDDYKDVIYSLEWDISTDSKFIDSVISDILFTHTDFVVNKLSRNDIDFCSLNKKELKKIKDTYPIKIQISNGLKKITIPSLEQLKKMTRDLENSLKKNNRNANNM